MGSADAIVIRDVSKHFRKHATRKDVTTFKSELVRILTGRKKPDRPSAFIPALRGVDLVIPKGKTVGIIGRNGSGKSTLLKLITGIYSPTTGTIEVDGRISALLDLGAGFHPDFTGRENILINGIILGMSASEVKARVQEIIDFSELGEFIDEPIRTYSSGMYMRLAFAVATHVDPDILIIDEILAVGDEHFGRKSLAKMMSFKEAGKTIVLVTHDLGTLERWCDIAAWIDGGKIRQVGDPRQVVNEYRQAVLLAESQGSPMLAPALSPDGGALPSLSRPAPPQGGPAAAPDRRWGSFQMELEKVRLLDGSGAEIQVAEPSQLLDVVIDFKCRDEVEHAVFSLSLIRDDGTLAFSTSTSVDDVNLPRPMPKSGTLRFRFDPICFQNGNYRLDVSVASKEGVTFDFHKGLYAFTVQSKVADAGLARPPHFWRLEAADGAEILGQVVAFKPSSAARS